MLALISTVFGMLMAVAERPAGAREPRRVQRGQELGALRGPAGCKESDTDGCDEVARLTGNQNRILLTPAEISPNIKNAVIAIEDKRFYEHEGVDYQGIARALWQDIRRQRAAQGGSTITQQFVKNALSAQGDRSVFQKLREAALAYHLERKWSKDKVLTQYLNTVYFGNGAYGVESAVRTYFGDADAPAGRHDGRGLPTPATTWRADATPAEAALLAGMIASPTLYDPVENPREAKRRRDLVLARMLEQQQDLARRSTRRRIDDRRCPTRADIDPPAVGLEPAVLLDLADAAAGGPLPAGRSCSAAGSKIKTTIDPELQAAARAGDLGPARRRSGRARRSWRSRTRPAR